MNDEAIYREIKEIFFLEAVTLLQRFEENILLLESSVTSQEVVECLFRDAHTIKGSAASVQFTELASYVHHLEELLSKLKRGETEVTDGLTAILFTALDCIRTHLDGLRKDVREALPVATLCSLIDALGVKRAPISVGPEDGIFFNDDLLPVHARNEVTAESTNAKTSIEKAAAPGSDKAAGRRIDDDYVSISLSKIENILNHFGEQVILQSALEHARFDAQMDVESLRRVIRQLSKITLMLQDSVLSLRMVPVRPIFQKTTRTLRDAAKTLGKDVTLETSGEEIELDKTLADRLAGPITHIIRNAVDHGIESPSDREKAGKPRRGTVGMHASYVGGYFNLEVRDDGRGLDKARLLAKAVAQGLVSADARLSDEEIHALIFHPGFSTRDAATELSGRGFGMDIVRKEVSDLRGTIQIRTRPGEGSTFVIQLPMSVAIFNGMVVSVAGTRCIVPNSEIGEVLNVRDLKRVGIQNGHEAVEVAKRVMPLVPLASVTRFTEERGDFTQGVVIVVHGGGKPYALHVDEIVSQQRVVMKNLGRELHGIPGVSGGAILADGNVAFVLKVGDIVEQFEKGAA